jgi:hypothetical protein
MAAALIRCVAPDMRHPGTPRLQNASGPCIRLAIQWNELLMIQLESNWLTQ